MKTLNSFDVVVKIGGQIHSVGKWQDAYPCLVEESPALRKATAEMGRRSGERALRRLHPDGRIEVIDHRAE